ncbi:MAG: sulfite exporter TauE/SafE family protein [Clostridia bacterium]|nr:sulfite exporter TauE/SafE family protein [Clostridia bacterium]
MSFWYRLLICLIAGAGAGFGTGFAGMSAAAVISPMLSAFLGLRPYEAIGIALASDVFASGISAWIYARKKNIDVKNGSLMLGVILLFTMLGSYLGDKIPENTMGSATTLMTFILGIRFLINPVRTTKENMLAVSKKRRIIGSVVMGILIGFICGFVGAGGGLMMLFALTAVLGYELKTAVGTSVFIMTFTALTGAVSHFAIGGMPEMLDLVLCVIFTFLFAQIASMIANRSKPMTLNAVTGCILLALGLTIVFVQSIP